MKRWLVIAGWFVPLAAGAQLPLPSFAALGGVTHYNLNGSGNTAIGALRADLPLFSLRLEGSVAVMRPHENDGTRTFVIPEAQLQYQLFPFLVQPYIGIGGGVFDAVAGPDPHRRDATFSASAGVRVGAPLIGVGLRAEARARGIGSGFSRSATELTIGLSF